MKTKIPKMTMLNCSRGAPMGCRNFIPLDIETNTKLNIRKLKWIDGDYTANGAYWGNTGKDFIYRATGETETERVEIFVRAENHKQAKEFIAEEIKKKLECLANYI